MKNIVLCEGLTDLLFLQYFMRHVYHWEDKKEAKLKFLPKARILSNHEEELIIGHCGGCSNIMDKLNKVKELNKAANETERLQRIVLVTDHDDKGYEMEIIHNVKALFDVKNFSYNTWAKISITDLKNETFEVELLVIMIPTDQYGAMETLLLESLADKDEYDKTMITRCNRFVDTIDEEKRYLKHRRHIVKAKFNTYFSIRVPEDFYTERQKLFQSFEWENYPFLLQTFQQLDRLSSSL